MRVLLIVHGFPPWAMGGTEIYTHDLARALADRCGDEVFVFAREADPQVPEYRVRTETRNGLRLTIVNNTFRACRSFEESYRNGAIRRIGAALLDEIRPDVVHVQHLTCLSTDLLLEFARRRIPTVFTLNDYWLICHRGQLLDEDYRRCEGPYPSGCSRCLGAAGAVGPAGYQSAAMLRRLGLRIPPGVAQLVLAASRRQDSTVSSMAASLRRLRHMRDNCTVVSHFLAPSRTLRERFLQFGIPSDKITYREQGIDQTNFVNVPRTKGDRLRIGFMGSLLVSKAPHLLLEAFAGLPAGTASLHLFGSYASYHGDDRYREQLEPLLAQPGVHRPGPIAHERVPEVLASLDVLVVPSIWIENAPFVIREAFTAGLPIVTSNLGGMAELVSHEKNGLLFEPGNGDDLCRCLRRLIDEPDLLNRLRSGIPAMRSVVEDAVWTRALYRSYLRPARLATPGDSPSVPAASPARPHRGRRPELSNTRRHLPGRSLRSAVTTTSCQHDRR